MRARLWRSERCTSSPKTPQRRWRPACSRRSTRSLRRWRRRGARTGSSFGRTASPRSAPKPTLRSRRTKPSCDAERISKSSNPFLHGTREKVSALMGIPWSCVCFCMGTLTLSNAFFLFFFTPSSTAKRLARGRAPASSSVGFRKICTRFAKTPRPPLAPPPPRHSSGAAIRGFPARSRRCASPRLRARGFGTGFRGTGTTAPRAPFPAGGGTERRSGRGQGSAGRARPCYSPPRARSGG
mmetsp:Transcript_21681/g.70049  ORF Transcript_21681/g.70049 Transcript_21681/m.70049 type:complete len:240 (+) Transcript_21681:727-1446(+)